MKLKGEGQVICENNAKALLVKCTTMEDGVFEIVHKYVTSFMDVPLNVSDKKN